MECQAILLSINHLRAPFLEGAEARHIPFTTPQPHTREAVNASPLREEIRARLMLCFPFSPCRHRQPRSPFRDIPPRADFFIEHVESKAPSGACAGGLPSHRINLPGVLCTGTPCVIKNGGVTKA